jgi:mono/diheme cytochrome c family protein
MIQVVDTHPHHLVLIVLLVLVAATGSAAAIAWAPAIPPVLPPDRASFSATVVARGAALAALGDCAVCHSAENGQPYAGGRGVPTPFGIVYATNITPDPATGIGRWPLAAFRRAMREGIDRRGRHLYPVLPYTHFTHATDADIAAIYAFLMTRQSVRQTAPENALPFPFNWRPLLAGWDLLYLHPGVWRPDPAKSREWNRGAYLVEAVSHCGACHTPRNGLGAERSGQAFAGGEVEGWYAPPLQVGSPAPRPWTVAALATYLRTGIDPRHGAAAGPMAEVTRALATVPNTDVHAIAVYIASLMPPASQITATSPAMRPVSDAETAAIFDGACGACHGADAPMTRNGAPSLALSTAVNAPTPLDVINIILHGLPWRDGYAGPYMPSFSDALTDTEIVALVTYVRARYSDQPAWHDVAALVRNARGDGGGM